MIVHCPHCRRKLTVDDALEGQRRLCPVCHVEFDIPTATRSAPHAPGSIERPPITPRPQPVGPDPATAGATGVLLSPAPAPASHAVPQPTITRPQSTAFPDGRRPIAPQDVSAFGQSLSALSRTFSPQKLGFFVLGGGVIAVVVAMMVWISARMVAGAASSSTLAAAFAWLVLTVIVAVGLLGVVAGGVAHLATCEAQGNSARIANAIRFCRRRFLSLFASLVLMLIALQLAVLLANGIVWIIREIPSLGPPLAALLFLPQAAANLILLVAALTCVLLPCIIAADDVGIAVAVPRLLEQYRRRYAALLGQLGLSLALAMVLGVVAAQLALGSLGMTIPTNGPKLGFDVTSLLPAERDTQPDFSALFQGIQDTSRNKAFQLPQEPTAHSSSARGSERGDQGGLTGDTLRNLSILLVLVCAIAVPAVYWIVSFTEFYRTAPPTQVASGRRAGLSHTIARKGAGNEHD